MTKISDRLGDRLDDMADRFAKLAKGDWPPEPEPEVTKAEPSARPASPQQLYRAADLAALFRVHTATIWKWAKAGVLPPPIKLGSGHYTAWRARDIEALLKERGRQ